MVFLYATDEAARVGKGWLEHYNVSNGFAGRAKGGKVRTEELRRRISGWVGVLLTFWACRWSIAPGRSGAFRGTAVTTPRARSTASAACTIRITVTGIGITVTGIQRSW